MHLIGIFEYIGHSSWLFHARSSFWREKPSTACGPYQRLPFSGLESSGLLRLDKLRVIQRQAAAIRVDAYTEDNVSLSQGFDIGTDDALASWNAGATKKSMVGSPGFEWPGLCGAGRSVGICRGNSGIQACLIPAQEA
jgi:hypothetical protein